LVFILGPCVIESYEKTYEIALFLRELTRELGVSFIFKASFDKANRSELGSFRGPGIVEGLKILRSIKDELGIRVTTDVHDAAQVDGVASVVDVVQIPAFLCRQTDLLLAAGGCGKPVNLKKGQFMSPWEMGGAVGKIRHGGCRDVTIIERGTCFGYNNLVVDFRGIARMREFWPVIFDATHSVQLPGVGGQAEFVPVLARAAVAVGVDGIFMEVHPEPDKALCDGSNSLKLDALGGVLSELIAIRNSVYG
jgi:2-dehydro-3-deoxyphosphooctonate aldolase (KDO 8-P synthase)